MGTLARASSQRGQGAGPGGGGMRAGSFAFEDEGSLPAGGRRRAGERWVGARAAAATGAKSGRAYATGTRRGERQRRRANSAQDGCGFGPAARSAALLDLSFRA